MKAQYAVLFADNSGNFAADAIAYSAEAKILSSVEKFDGEYDMAVFLLDDENTVFFEEMLEHDTNVVSYREHP